MIKKHTLRVSNSTPRIRKNSPRIRNIVSKMLLVSGFFLTFVALSKIEWLADSGHNN